MQYVAVCRTGVMGRDRVSGAACTVTLSIMERHQRRSEISAAIGLPHVLGSSNKDINECCTTKVDRCLYGMRVYISFIKLPSLTNTILGLYYTILLY